jgi:hypothetical protein
MNASGFAVRESLRAIVRRVAVGSKGKEALQTRERVCKLPAPENELLAFWRRSARPLLGRDGFDDELPAIARIERRFRAMQCQVH